MRRRPHIPLAAFLARLLQATFAPSGEALRRRRRPRVAAAVHARPQTLAESEMGACHVPTLVPYPHATAAS
eukprot:361631-Chlamydomonas_euryale.AAC.9